MDISLVDYCYVHGQALAADKTLEHWEKNFWTHMHLQY
jgi:hypothetical protein